MDKSKWDFEDVVNRAEQGDFKEYWLQRYIAESYEKFGFDSIEGPFEYGIDFIGVYKGNKVLIEAERFPINFVQHGHPTDVDFLIVFKEEYVGSVKGMQPEEWKKLLPKKIIVIDPKDFIVSTHEMRKEYAIMKEKEKQEQKIKMQQDEKEREALLKSGRIVRIYNIPKALTFIWSYLEGEVPEDGIPEFKSFSKALASTAAIYVRTYDIKNDENGKSPKIRIENIAYELSFERKINEKLTQDDLEFIDMWIEILQEEYSQLL